MRICLLLVLCTFILQDTVTAQKSSAKQVSNKYQEVKNCDSIIYYGADFSHVRITDGPKVSKNPAYRGVYPPAWIAYLEKEMPPTGFVKKSLGKKFFDYLQDEIHDVSVNVDPYFIIGYPYAFPIDTVGASVRGYNLSQSTGTGLVLIAENFSKPDEKATTWVVFFDIRTREVLWASKTSGKCSHMGYTAHWASGVIEGFKKFIRHEYR